MRGGVPIGADWDPLDVLIPQTRSTSWPVFGRGPASVPIYTNITSGRPWPDQAAVPSNPLIAVYAFIENQEYTLVDVPLFLKDPSFRNMLVGNMKYNHQAVNFWKYEFSPKEAEATLTRVETLLGDPYVSHIVSQARSTINFTTFINDRRILLFKLPDTLSTEVKTFIGTIIISELVHAVRLRSTTNPPQFSIFVDEFQQFCGYEDFAVLFTQARKYGVATTIAHQERVESGRM